MPAAPKITSIKNPSLDATVRAMQGLAREGRKNLRPLAASICAEIESGDYNSEINALYNFVCKNIRYAKDPHDVEYVQAPKRLLESRQGDCDDMACLMASLCMAMGHECRFVVVGFDGSPSHVFCQVAVRGAPSVDGSGRGEKLWVTLDPVAAEFTGQMHSRVNFTRVYGI